MFEHIYILPILLFSVVIHELAHGWMALRLGDPTAKMMGRLTFNPIPHIDPVGSILVPVFSIIVAGQVFIAWAKPVPVNPMNFSDFKRDNILVSIVGPSSNFILAFVCTVCYIVLALIFPFIQQSSSLGGEILDFLFKMFAGGITLNIVLGVFNLIPIPPLDGSHVIASLLPDELSEKYQSIGFLGIFIIILLLRWHPFYSLFRGIIEVLIIPFQILINLFIG